MSVVRTLTVDDDLALSRVGYERGDVLLSDTGSPAAHRYKVDTRSSLVADGLVLLESTDATPTRFRFLDTNGLPLTVRDLRRFRILLKVADGHRATPAAPAPVRPTPATASPELVEMRDDALDNDLLDGVDFTVDFAVADASVSGVADGVESGSASASLAPSVSDECIAFEAAADGFVVSYRDSGVATVLFTSRSMAQARAVFLDEACWLGAERGRGTYVGRSQAVGTEDWTPAQVVAAYERRLLGDD